MSTMSTDKNIKVVWLCNFSNGAIRQHLQFSSGRIDSLLRRLTGSAENIHQSDYGQWITNGINGISTYDNVELHVISPHYRLKEQIENFCIDNIYYHFYSDESFSFLWKFLNKIGLIKRPHFKKNCKTISRIIDKIKPDIIHLIGAENINYSIYGLNEIPHIPLIVQLQTLVNDPKVYSAISGNRDYIREIEKQLLNKADYVFTTVPSYITIIRETLAPDAIIMANKLAVGVNVDTRDHEKEYDFVYFSANINKAADLAIQSFAIAKQKYPDISLDIIGAYSVEYKQYLDNIIKNNKLDNSVHFEGLMPTHDDVLFQVKKARFALLPLRPDVLPSTIREAMSVGCPVITSITESTPKLNSTRQSVLLSDKESPESHAENMCRLLGNPLLAAELRNNAFITVHERYDNKDIVKRIVESYQICINHFYYKRPIPQEYLL